MFLFGHLIEMPPGLLPSEEHRLFEHIPLEVDLRADPEPAGLEFLAGGCDWGEGYLGVLLDLLASPQKRTTDEWTLLAEARRHPAGLDDVRSKTSTWLNLWQSVMCYNGLVRICPKPAPS